MKANWSAEGLLEATGSYWQGCTIMAAVRLDIFNALEPKPETAAGLATRLAVDPSALHKLLRALAALGLLEKKGEKYACSDAASRLLVSASAGYLGHIICHQHHLLESWAHLDQAIKMGQPQRQHAGHTEEEWRASFLLGMQDLANLVAPQIVPLIDIGTRCRLLDLGGGPGTWSIHFCRHHASLRSTIFDQPTSRTFAEKAVTDAGLGERIDFFAGDFNQAELPGRYDLIWMSHILHGEGEANCTALISKAAAALDAGGLLLIHEFILGDQGSGPVYPALFALNMLLGTEEGAAYTEAQLRAMLVAAGLLKIERLELPAQSRSGVLLAHKAAGTHTW